MCQLCIRKLELCGVSHLPDAKIGKTQRGQVVLRLLSPRQILRGDRRFRGDAGGKAGVSGLIPGKQAGLLRQAANVGLCQSTVPERGIYLQLPLRLHSGAISCIV